MSRAFSCDICGDCVLQESDAKNSREIQRGIVTIDGVQVEMSLILSAGVPHVCGKCWALLMKKLKQWASNNIPD